MPPRFDENFKLTSRIQKGGALLGDMRQLVTHWSQKRPEQTDSQFAREILSKATQARAKDTFIRAFQPRFINGNPPEAWRLCACIEDSNLPREAIPPFYYWVTSCSEPLLYRFVTEEVNERFRSGFLALSSEETAEWIRRTCRDEGLVWADIVNIKVARAMLAALRDFGVLKGAAKKQIAPMHVPLETFALIAFCLKVLLGDSREPTQHPDWRLFLLSPGHAERFYFEAHQHGWLDFQSAGGITRLEFPASTFEEYVRHITT